MDIPKKKDDEKQKEYIDRLMKMKKIIDMYPDIETRKNACKSMWKKNDRADNIDDNNSADNDSHNTHIEHRIDFIDMNEEHIMEEPFVLTDEGYLKGRANVTNIGVFTYVLADGSERRELRTRDEVFDWESLQSLKMCPLTNDHPPVAVTADNIKEYQVGYAGEKVHTNSDNVSIPLLWTDKDTIADIEGGKQSLSCGYSTGIVMESGVWNGVPYDARQTEIRYNHIANVDAGRAGDAVVMKFDGLENVAYQCHDNIKLDNSDGGKNIMKKFKIDGVEYEAEADVIRHVNKLTNDNKELSGKLDTVEKEKKDSKATLEAEMDQLKEDKAELEKKLDLATKSSPEEIQKRVDERLVLIGAGKIAGVDIKSDMSDLDAKKEIIKKISPNSAEKVDSAEEVYINARFDVAIEKLEEMKEDEAELEDTLRKDSLTHKEEKVDSVKARQRMIAWATSAHSGGK